MARVTFDKNALRKLEREIQTNIERKIAPRVQRDQIEPLRSELAALARSHRGKSEAVVRPLVQAAFKRHGLNPQSIDPLVSAIRRGEPIPSIDVKVDRPRLG